MEERTPIFNVVYAHFMVYFEAEESGRTVKGALRARSWDILIPGAIRTLADGDFGD